MMDILTGTITELETGDLVLSMFSLNLYAKRFDLNLSPLELNWDSLKSMFSSQCHPGLDPGSCERVIAHIDGNHYIIITNITTRVVDGKTIEEVHYTDPGAGPETDLDQLVLSKEDFLEAWTAKKLQVTENGQNRLESLGYILAPRAPPVGTEGHPALDAGSYRTLTMPEQMQIRGAFFPLIFVAIAAVVAIIKAVVVAVVAAIVAVISAIVAGIGSIIAGFGTFFSSLFAGNFLGALTGLFNGLVAGFGQIGGALLAGAHAFQGSLIAGLGLQTGGLAASAISSSFVTSAFV
ncbi:MAG TPA: hypothetical protein DIS66_03045, partial [Candidatus Omnitrophica bacterium]|nr:hypothetical protein [Candidatus Omnitrophota bacterium]